MALILHIIIALTSIIYTSYVYIIPSKKKLQISYILAAATLTTGSFLLISKPSHLVQSCIMGLVYLGFVIFALASARHKLSSFDIK
ncbi:MAG: hypothetical protein AAB675_00025 [Patescibacteria group bacterium]